MAKQNPTSGQAGQAATSKTDDEAATNLVAATADSDSKANEASRTETVHSETGHENAGHAEAGHSDVGQSGSNSYVTNPSGHADSGDAAPDVPAKVAGGETEQHAVGTGAGRPMSASSMIGAADSEAINSNLRGLAAGSMRLMT